MVQIGPKCYCKLFYPVCGLSVYLWFKHWSRVITNNHLSSVDYYIHKKHQTCMGLLMEKPECSYKSKTIHRQAIMHFCFKNYLCLKKTAKGKGWTMKHIHTLPCTTVNALLVFKTNPQYKIWKKQNKIQWSNLFRKNEQKCSYCVLWQNNLFYSS